MTDTPTDPPLLPCPFCGGAATIFRHPRADIWRLTHDCAVMGAMGLNWTDERAELTRTWNTRA